MGWQPRYVILKDRKIKYYKTDNEKDFASPQGVINMESFEITLDSVKDNDGLNFNIALSGNDRVF